MMRVVQLDYADRSFPASLVEVDEPELPGPDWARVEVVAGGLCGSDLHLFKQTTGPTPLLSAYVALPMQLGHEIAGRVIEAGPDCPVGVGTPVAVDPVIACEARGIEPPCEHCAKGEQSACHNISSKRLTPGMGLGFTNGLGSGWADQVLAHASMLHSLPEGVAAVDASTHEPLSIAVHGMLRQPPPQGSPILVVGAGIIGLGAVAAARDLFPASEITVLAKYPHQAGAAETLGAHHVVAPGDGAFSALAEIVGTRVVKSLGGVVLAGGFPYVVEAVGAASTVNDALRLVDGRGTVLLLGAAGISEVDLTPVFFKEVALVGAFCHAADPGPGGTPSAHSIDRSLEIMAAGGFPSERLVTHRFRLADYRDAIAAGTSREQGAIKVVFEPQVG